MAMNRNNGHGEFNAFNNPFVQPVANPADIDKFLNADKNEEFVALLYFSTVEEATDWGKTYSKCLEHGLKEKAQLFFLIAKARCAVKGDRAKLAAQVAIRVAIPEFFDGRTYREPSKNKQPAQPSTV